MRISQPKMIMSILVMCVTGCAGDGIPEDEDAIGVTEQSLTSGETSGTSRAVQGTQFDELVANVPVTNAAANGECRGPRPRNRGCSIICKPCFIAECEDGKWVYESVDWGDECSGGGGGGGGTCCQVPLSGGCPAECQCCNYTP